MTARAALREVVAYNTDRAPIALDLSHNTNLFGAPPSALAAIRGVEDSAISEYPGLDSADARRALGAYANVAPETIIVGCGSDDIIEATFRAFAVPGETIAFPSPTFSMVPTFARVNGLAPVAVPLGDDFDIDVDGLLAVRARITYVATPNNPYPTSTLK